MFNNSSNKQYRKNIHLISFSLNDKVYKEKNEILVSITTLPEHNKQSFKISGKEISQFYHVFTVDITEKTEDILLVFRKKKTLENSPIIGSTTIHLSSQKEQDIQILNIYEPRQHMNEPKNKLEPYTNKTNRQIIGQMKIQFLENEINSKCNDNNKKDKKKNLFKVNKMNQENQKFNKMNNLEINFI